MTNEFWLAIMNRDFELPLGQSTKELTPRLLAQLGSPNSQLRETSWEILGAWTERGVYSPAELRPLRDSLAQNLSTGIKDGAKDSVFARSFSALVMGRIVERDARESFLSDSELRSCVEAASTYLVAEPDLRGYVPANGWIHATAHAGDLLRALAQHPGVSVESLERILGAMAQKITMPVEYVYVRMEDERLAAAAKTALRRDSLPASVATEWFARLARPGPGGSWPDLIEGSRAEVCAWHNTRDFLRSLFFQITLANESSAQDADLLTEITSALQSMDFGFYR